MMYTQPTHVGIIGTAGRKEAAAHLNYEVYLRMLEDARRRVQEIQPDPQKVELVSGGAAWADHLAVLLFLQGAAAKLTLFLPTALASTGFYVERSGRWQENPGGTANHYHRQFTSKIRAAQPDSTWASHLDLQALPGREGVTLDIGTGFLERNITLARYVGTGHLLAYTFGMGDEPADGGTLHTWRTATQAHRQHVSIGRLKGE